jgi:hypothetical protein
MKGETSMHKITLPTTLRPVQIARLLEREGSPLAPLAEEIYDLAMFYRIDAAFALAQCMVESKLGCTLAAQANRSAALVPLAVARMAAPVAEGTAIPILPPRYGDEYSMGYVTYPSWLTGLEEYFRILRLIFVDAWHEERVEDVARAFLASAPNRRRPAPPKPVGGRTTRHHPQPARQGPLTARSPEVIAYARRVERYRHQFQAEAGAAQHLIR